MNAHLADPEHNPSFTRGVFLGEIREDLVFPFPELAPGEKESLRRHRSIPSARGRPPRWTRPGSTARAASGTTFAPAWPNWA